MVGQEGDCRKYMHKDGTQLWELEEAGGKGGGKFENRPL